MTRTASLAAAVLLGCSLVVHAHAAAPIPPEPGLWWDITTEMTIRGPNVPAQVKPQTETHRECIPKKLPDRPPSSPDCQISDFKRSGGRMTFRSRCAQGITGEADLVWTADTYAGTMIMRGQGMENRITMKGKKVGGDCDASEDLRREAEERAAAAEDAQDGGQKQLCNAAAQSGDLEAFLPPEPGAPAACMDATRFCAALETREGLTQLRQSGREDAAQQAGKLCRKDVSAIERRLCAAVGREPEKKLLADEELSEFLFAACPDLSRTLAKRACAGRSYTGMTFAKREFCTRWAQEALQGR
jgi:hypothetical protein